MGERKNGREEGREIYQTSEKIKAESKITTIECLKFLVFNQTL